MNERMDATIRIRDLAVRGIVGFKAEEREHAQDLLINVCVDVDIAGVVRSDSIDEAMNYRTISKALLECATNAQPYSLERLAFLMLDTTFRTSELIESATLRVEKVGALRYSAGVSVELSMSRTEWLVVA